MTNLEQVQKLREYANISFEEAKKVLEEAEGDILEAVIILERENRIDTPEAGGHYHSKEVLRETTQKNDERKSQKEKDKADKISFSEVISEFLRWSGKVIHKGNVNSFEVVKNEKIVMTIPITLLVVLLIFAFWFAIPVLIAGLIFGYRYSFKGKDIDNTNVNQAMDKVSDATLRAVDSVSDAAKKASKDFKNKKGDHEDGENSDY